MYDLTGNIINNVKVLGKAPRKVDEQGRLLRDEKNRTLPIMYNCECLRCGAIFKTTTRNLRYHKGICQCQKNAIRQKKFLALENNRENLLLHSDDIHCAYPNKNCYKSLNGVCCWDCEEYEQCCIKGIVCKNTPAKCGSK